MVLIRQSSIWSNAISAEKFELLNYYNVLRELENSQPAITLPDMDINSGGKVYH
jgi:hypothetical protein